MSHGSLYDLAAEPWKWKQCVRKQRGKVLSAQCQTELGTTHCGLGTSLLASRRRTGECSEKSHKDDKWAERLIYEDLHNKIRILGSTKTSEESDHYHQSSEGCEYLRGTPEVFSLISEMMTRD